MEKSTKAIVLVLLLLSFLTTEKAFAQKAINTYVNNLYKNVPDKYNVLSSSNTRRVIDLNGIWQVKFGDSENWSNIFVPSSIDYNGTLNFRKSFILPRNIDNYQIQLYSLAINYNCIIKINGIYIGAHSSGFTGVSFDILHSALKPGEENLIEIEVLGGISYNSFDLPRPQPWGWKSYSGIVREIYLLLQPKITIVDWSVKYEFTDNYNTCNTTFKFLFQNFYQNDESSRQNEPDNIRSENIQEAGYYIEIFNERSGALVKSTSSEPRFVNVHRAIEDTMKLNLRNVELWSPQNPVEYMIRVTIVRQGNVVIDRFNASFGFRDVNFRKDGLYLNGKKIVLNGIYRVEQHPDYGISLPYDVQKRDIQMIKNLGMNAIRTGPYPNHPYFYEICDELGVLVFTEIHVDQVPGRFLGNDEFIDKAKIALNEMIELNRLHPSIIAWGIGSNLDVTHSNTAKYVSKMTAFVHDIDDRPVYYSTEIPENDLCEEFADLKLLDLFSPSIEKLTSVYNTIQNKNVNKPVFLGKIGSYLYPDNVGGYRNPASLSHQAKYVSDLFDFTQKQKDFPGIFYCGFADWRGDAFLLVSGSGYPGEIYYRGFVSEDRQEQRLAFSYLKAAIIERKMTPLTMGNPPNESQKTILFTGFGIILAMLITIKQRKWFGQNYRRSLIFAKTYFVDVNDKRNIQLWHTLFLGIVICSGFALGIAGLSYYYKSSIGFDLIISQFFVTPGIKRIIIFLTWHPITNIAALTFVFFSVLMIITVFFNITLILFGLHRGFMSSMNLIVWPGSHLVFLIPFTMSIYSALLLQASMYIFEIIILIFILLYIFRYFLAVKVTYGRRFNRAVLCSVAVLVLSFSAVAYYYQSTYLSFTYLNHILATF